LQPVSAMVWRGVGIWSGLGVQAPKYLYLPGPDRRCGAYLQPVSAMVWPARGILSALGVQAHWTFEPISTSMDIIVAGAPSPPNTQGLPEDKKIYSFTLV
jgi:hypothetical protein